jgi:uncharacterized damage-inducible protein DinB
LQQTSKLHNDELTKDRGSSFPSILDIFIHVLDVYIRWLLFAYKDRTRKYKTIEDTNFSIEQLRKEEQKINAAVMKLVNEMSPSDLKKSFSYYDDEKQTKRVRRNTEELFWHLVEEELQHRGELNVLLWQMDVDPPITSWFVWKRQQEKQKV